MLFAFFVVMYSAAQLDKRRAGQLATAIQTAFEQRGSLPPEPADVGGLSATGVPTTLPIGNTETDEFSLLKGQIENALAGRLPVAMLPSVVLLKGWSSACAKLVFLIPVPMKSSPAHSPLSHPWLRSCGRPIAIFASKVIPTTFPYTIHVSVQTGTSRLLGPRPLCVCSSSNMASIRSDSQPPDMLSTARLPEMTMPQDGQ